MREKKGLSRAGLAARTNLSTAYIKLLEEDNSVPLEIIERLAEALNTTPEFLKTGDAPVDTQTLRNFERYVIDKGILIEEATTLKEMINKKKLRSSSPLNFSDFDVIRERYRASEPVIGICWRCGSMVRSITGDYCSNCGRPWDTPSS